MSILETAMEKHLTLEGSSYYIRKAYLRAMRQFMADNKDTSQPQFDEDIEEYLVYEKRISRSIQELLEHSDLKIAHY